MQRVDIPMPPLYRDRFGGFQNEVQTPDKVVSQIQSMGSMMREGLRDLLNGDINAKGRFAIGVLGVLHASSTRVDVPVAAQADVLDLTKQAARFRLVAHDIVRSLDDASGRSQTALHPMTS